MQTVQVFISAFLISIEDIQKWLQRPSCTVVIVAEIVHKNICIFSTRCNKVVPEGTGSIQDNVKRIFRNTMLPVS